MDPFNLPLLSSLTDKMRFLSARASTIAENIANADTPGYIAKDLNEVRTSSFSRHLPSESIMKSSHPEHITAARTSRAGSNMRTTTTKNTETSLTGNTVSIEEETLKLSQTRMEYGLASTLYRKSLDMLRLAARSDRQ